MKDLSDRDSKLINLLKDRLLKDSDTNKGNCPHCGRKLKEILPKCNPVNCNAGYSGKEKPDDFPKNRRHCLHLRIYNGEKFCK